MRANKSTNSAFAQFNTIFGRNIYTKRACETHNKHVSDMQRTHMWCSYTFIYVFIRIFGRFALNVWLVARLLVTSMWHQLEFREPGGGGGGIRSQLACSHDRITSVCCLLCLTGWSQNCLQLHQHCVTYSAKSTLNSPTSPDRYRIPAIW